MTKTTTTLTYTLTQAYILSHLRFSRHFFASQVCDQVNAATRQRLLSLAFCLSIYSESPAMKALIKRPVSANPAACDQHTVHIQYTDSTH